MTEIANLLQNAGGRHGVLTAHQRKLAGALLAEIEGPLAVEARYALALREHSRTVDTRIGRDYLLRDALRRLAGVVGLV